MLLKSLFDRILSAIGLLVLWPVLIVVAILIHIKMPGGPVLFRQQRVGRDGRLFTMMKFRTMDTNHGGNTISVAKESRQSSFSSQLRRYKLDELPQLWNVLKGEMSFVGPRPDVPGYADQLKGEDKRILELLPGITGPASLKYRNEEELLAKVDEQICHTGVFITEDGRSVRSVQEYNDEVIYPDKVKINLYYLNNYSFLKDLQMIVCTVLGKNMQYAGETI